MSPRPPREDLSSFSLRLWRRPGVEQACLWLQERCGADVNLLLLCCWLGSEGRPADGRFLAGAAAAVTAWRAAAVEPLRRVRRRLADGVRGVPRAWRAPVRARALAAELEAERVEQLVLARRAARLLARAPRPGQAAANLDRYRRLLKTPSGGSVERRLAVLRAASEREGGARRAAG